MDIVRRIRDFNAGREPERLQMKYRNMRQSAFVFLRGSCHLFYDRLPRAGVFKSAPPVWVCGDLHLENFGSYKGDNRLAYFDLNDFDEAALAPASWDLVRMLTSVRVAAQTISLSAKEARSLCRAFLSSYAAALAGGKAYWLERDTAEGLVRQLLDDVRGRDRAAFIAKRTRLEGKRRVLKTGEGTKMLPADEGQKAAVDKAIRRFAATQAEPAFYEVIDVARRIAGTGSLGLVRYAILVRGRDSAGGPHLLDLKQVLPSSLLPHLKLAQPRWPSQAERSVTLQRRAQAVSMAFLHPTRLGKMPCVLRALQPSEDRVELDRNRQSMAQLEQTLRVMGELVAWSHLRSAGRQGSAIADELVAYGHAAKWQSSLMDASADCAAQAHKDWKTYSTAFDDKAFDAA